ncbi:MAG: hypothetical protein R2749_03575 [Acidimicrobiales bacterium]
MAPTDALGTAQYAGVFVSAQRNRAGHPGRRHRHRPPAGPGGGAAGSVFELTARDAIWFNNPVTNEAGRSLATAPSPRSSSTPTSSTTTASALVAGGPGPIGRNEGIGAGGGTGTGPGGGADEGAIDTEAP